ncbi:hypothetical protein AMATHDRAFT_150829 [Amanita thiersii Skay4041]|uniref:GS catalytic domain-containing protein n=1 Tax=Amanita thiersii Skay4041 TaxID=703135 RepID=A0A2A9NI65_9AGAR|nr:hypothetical protein AMATHDRAFT_150829 [Amanita thiersii Skay4041]
MTSKNVVYVSVQKPVSSSLFSQSQHLKTPYPVYIRLQWVDFANVVKFRVLSLSYFEKLLQEPYPGVVINNNPITDLVNTDLFSILAAVKQREAKTEFGIDYLVGFETEFMLLQSTEPLVAAGHHRSSAFRALLTGTVVTTVMQKIADSLRSSGVELMSYHAKQGPGQYSVSTVPLAPLEAVDALVHTHETIRNIASKHGLIASFAPRLFPESAGNGLHAHISVHSTQEGNKHPDKLSQYETSFLAGILDHLPGLITLTLPISPSYRRMRGRIRSISTFVCWGVETRGAPVGVKDIGSPSSRRFEFRALDCTANPYIALAGVLIAGYTGIKSGQDLTIQDLGCIDAAELDEYTREALDANRSLPLSWREARSVFIQDRVLQSLLGQEFVTEYMRANMVFPFSFFFFWQAIWTDLNCLLSM